MNLKQSTNQRMGQSIFNFLEWLHVKKGYDTNQAPRIADPFHIQDDEFKKLWEEWLNAHPPSS